MQQIPKVLRNFPENYGKLQLMLAGFYFYIIHGYKPSREVSKRNIPKVIKALLAPELNSPQS
jgi:hypothetical protein